MRLDGFEDLPVVDRERDFFLFLRLKCTSTLAVGPLDQLLALQFYEMGDDVFGANLLLG